jgi:hypothetical protein
MRTSAVHKWIKERISSKQVKKLSSDTALVNVSYAVFSLVHKKSAAKVGNLHSALMHHLLFNIHSQDTKRD